MKFSIKKMLSYFVVLTCLHTSAYAGWFGKSDDDLVLKEVKSDIGVFSGSDIEGKIYNNSDSQGDVVVWVVSSSGTIFCASTFTMYPKTSVDFDIDCDALAANTFQARSGWAENNKSVLTYAQKNDQYTRKSKLNYEINKAEKTGPKGYYELGLKYIKGEDGFEKSNSEGQKWLAKSAESGYADALLYLAKLSIDGRNYDAAYTLMIIASSKGANVSKDLKDMALMHLSPSDIQKSEQKAQEWLQEHR